MAGGAGVESYFGYQLPDNDLVAENFRSRDKSWDNSADLNLSAASGQFSVNWFDPRAGGALKKGAVTSVRGGGSVSLGAPPDAATEDWLLVVRRN